VKPVKFLALGVVALGASFIDVGAAFAGPCTAKIAEVEQKIRQVQATAPPGGPGEPSLPQSVGAQLHHQPTVNSVEHAEGRASADAAAALDRARQADAAGNTSACAKALQDAKDLYGIY
jgi:hypothetical protein